MRTTVVSALILLFASPCLSATDCNTLKMFWKDHVTRDIADLGAHGGDLECPSPASKIAQALYHLYSVEFFGKNGRISDKFFYNYFVRNVQKITIRPGVYHEVEGKEVTGDIPPGKPPLGPSIYAIPKTKEIRFYDPIFAEDADSEIYRVMGLIHEAAHISLRDKPEGKHVDCTRGPLKGFTPICDDSGSHAWGRGGAYSHVMYFLRAVYFNSNYAELPKPILYGELNYIAEWRINHVDTVLLRQWMSSRPLGEADIVPHEESETEKIIKERIANLSLEPKALE